MNSIIEAKVSNNKKNKKSVQLFATSKHTFPHIKSLKTPEKSSKKTLNANSTSSTKTDVKKHNQEKRLHFSPNNSSKHETKVSRSEQNSSKHKKVPSQRRRLAQNVETKFNTGRWHQDEHERFIEAILKYGNEWKKSPKICQDKNKYASTVTCTEISEQSK